MEVNLSAAADDGGPEGDAGAGEPSALAGSEATDVPPGADVRALMRQLTERQQRFERQIAQRLKVDAAGLAALQHLIAEGPATPTELSRRLGVSTAAMSLVIDRLEAAGHVSRQPHPTDRRKVVVTASAPAREAAYRQTDPLIEGVTRLAAALTPQERATVAMFLDGVVAVYDRVTG